MNLMGLLEDKDALMTLAASLLSAPKGQEGAALGQGLLGAMQVKRQNADSDLARQGKQQSLLMGNMQMEEMRRLAGVRQSMTEAAQRNFQPGQPQMQPNDYETPSGPAGPGSMNMQGYAQDLMRAGPEGVDKGVGILSSLRKQETPLKLGRDDRLVDPRSFKEVVPAAPEKPPTGFKLGPDGNWVADPEWLKAQKEIRAAGRPAVDVKVNSFVPASEEAQREFMKSTRATYDQLKAAPVALENIERAKALIPAAKGFMGPGGEGMLQAAKFLNNRVGLNINTEGVKSAEELRTRIFQNVMDNLKKMDAQPSEMQQRMMMDALGKLGTDPGALPQVLDAFADTIKGKVAIHNQEVAGASERGVRFPYDPIIKAGKQQPLQRNLTAIYKAKQAISQGADAAAVRQRLREQGFDDSGL